MHPAPARLVVSQSSDCSPDPCGGATAPGTVVGTTATATSPTRPFGRIMAAYPPEESDDDAWLVAIRVG